MTHEILTWIVLYSIPAVFLAIGAAAYRGKWRSWAAKEPRHFEYGKRSYFGFFVFYSGICIAAMVTMALAGSVGAPAFVINAIGVLMLPAWVIVASTLTRFPRFLQPAWYRRWIAAGEIKTHVLPAGRTGNLVLDWLQRRADRNRPESNRPAGQAPRTLSVFIVRPYRQRTAKCKKLGK